MKKEALASFFEFLRLEYVCKKKGYKFLRYHAASFLNASFNNPG